MDILFYKRFNLWITPRCLNIKTVFLTSMLIPIIKIRRSSDRLIFIIKTIYNWKGELYVETLVNAIGIDCGQQSTIYCLISYSPETMRFRSPF